MKRTALKSVGRKRRSKQAQRATLVQRVLARDNYRCQFPERLADFCEGLDDFTFNAMMRVMCCGPLDVHEIIPRSVWPDGELVDSNALTICRLHHQYIDGHPNDAEKLGLHGRSWHR